MFQGTAALQLVVTKTVNRVSLTVLTVIFWNEVICLCLLPYGIHVSFVVFITFCYILIILFIITCGRHSNPYFCRSILRTE